MSDKSAIRSLGVEKTGLEKFELARFLPYRMTVAAERIASGLAAQYGAKYNLSAADWRVLVHVADAGKVSIRDIQNRVHLEKSKASRAASRMVEAGYLTKRVDQSDRRLVELELTREGAALMAELTALAQAYQEKLEELVAPFEAQLDKALKILTESDLD